MDKASAPAVFAPAGTVDGILLVVHDCHRYRIAYVSATPSADGDPYVIPGCGCRP
jgi:hypothetical protein